MPPPSDQPSRSNAEASKLIENSRSPRSVTYRRHSAQGLMRGPWDQNASRLAAIVQHRRLIELEIIDLETSIPAAERRDAANLERNKARRQGLGRAAAETDKKIGDATANGEWGKALGHLLGGIAGQAAGETVAGAFDLDVNEASRLRSRLADLRRKLLELRDAK